LLTSGGAASLVLAGLSAWWLPPSISDWQWFNLLFGVAAFFLFALLLQCYPRWLKGTRVRYARFGLVFFLLAAAQLLFHLTAGLFSSPGILYLLPLLAAWVLTLATLKGIQILAPRDLLLVRCLNVMLHLAAVGLLLNAAGLLFDWHELTRYTLWFGLAGVVLPLLLILVGYLGKTASPHAIP
jgi:hypothetical protein